MSDIKLNLNSAITKSLELTVSAIENDLIRKGSTSAETAKNVYDFFSTLVDNLADPNEK